jgi:hypothetical protein
MPRNVRIQIEPMATWTYPETANRSFSRFGATYSDTLDILDRELHYLDAHRHGAVALRMVTKSGNVRRDGMLRAEARIDHPGTALAFGSKFGPMEIYCDRFTTGYGNRPWQSNLRAIALGLEALRKVDRYGIGGTGEQYQGWLAIEAAPIGLAAAEVRLREIAEARPETSLETAFRMARAKTHPDRHGGHQALWDEVEKIAAQLGLL